MNNRYSEQFLLKLHTSAYIGLLTGRFLHEIKSRMAHFSLSMIYLMEKTNIKEGTIDVVIFLGVIVRCFISMSGEYVIVDITEKDFEKAMFRTGETVQLYFPPEDFLIFS